MSTTYARTINGNTIYAAICDADADGNTITTTYATKSEVQNIDEVPAVTDQDNGKVLQVVNGVWTLVSPVTLYSGTGTPSNSQGNNGDLYMQI
jgi:hypothetical protein